MKSLSYLISFLFIFLPYVAAKDLCSSVFLESSSKNNPVKALTTTNIRLSKSILDNSHMHFYKHIGKPNSYENVLVFNIEPSQVFGVRKTIEQVTGKQLKFLTSWQENGEAHVTTITSVEFANVLRPYISIERINEIAREMNIQNSDLKILGIGSGKGIVKGEESETFFLIVDSSNLKKIRYQVYKEFVQNGGEPKSFDPTWFFPHITIGYTKNDVHERHGLLKSVKHSFDSRFQLEIVD